MTWYYLFALLCWPVLNLGKLIHSWVTNDDIGFIFFYRWIFKVYGPYDLVLSDFFSRITSSIIVFIVSSIFGGLTIWLYLL